MWFFLAFFAGALFAANKIIFRRVFTKPVDPIGFLAAHDLLAGLLLLPLALPHFSYPHSLSIWLMFGAGLIFIFLADVFAALSLRHTEASIYQIVGQLRNVATLFGGYLLFKESVTLAKVIAIVIITGGVIIAVKNKGKFAVGKGVVYAFCSAMAIAIALLFIKKAAVDVHPAFAAAASLLVAGLLAYAVLFWRGKGHAKLLPDGHRTSLVLAASIFALFEFVLFSALNMGEASKVTPVSQSSMIFTLLGGYFFLGERAHLVQKIIGGVAVAAGIALLFFA